MKHSQVLSLALGVMSLFAISCGKQSNIVTGIQVSTRTVEQDVFLSMNADLNLGNLSFPAISLPIPNPKGGDLIGSVDLVPVLGGKNQIKVNLNMTELAHVNAQQAVLPNGNSIPLIANNPTIVVNLGKGARLYLTASETVTAIGVAIPISTFDSIGAAVPGVNLFPMFAIDKAIGAAGIFTSKNAGQNGFALIADVSAYLKQDASVSSSAMMALSPQEEVKLEYEAQAPSEAKEAKINRMIIDLNKTPRKLRLH